MSSSFQSLSTRSGRSHGVSARKDRKALFQDAATTSRNNGGYKTPRSARKRTTGASSSTASEAQMIQQSLQRTQNLLKSELDRVNQVSTAIDEDGKLLEDTKKTHESLNVSGAQKALTSLQRAQQQEQRVLMASVVFFFAVVFHIMWSRILVKLPFVELIIHLAFSTLRTILGNATVLARDLLKSAGILIKTTTAANYGE